MMFVTAGTGIFSNEAVTFAPPDGITNVYAVSLAFVTATAPPFTFRLSSVRRYSSSGVTVSVTTSPADAVSLSAATLPFAIPAIVIV